MWELGAQQRMADVAMAANKIATASRRREQGQTTMRMESEAKDGIIEQGTARGVPSHEHTTLKAGSETSLQGSGGGCRKTLWSSILSRSRSYTACWR